MIISERQPPESTNTRNDPERVLFIAADANGTARISGKLDSVTEERLQVPWVTELSGESDTEDPVRQTVQLGEDDHVVNEQANGYRLQRTVRTMMDRRAEGEAALDSQMADATLNSIGAGVLRTDLRGNVTYLNRFAEKMTGWLREEALGRPVEDVLRLVDSASGAAIDDAVTTVLQGDRTGAPMICAIDCTLLRRDGVELGIENRVTIIDDQAGNALGVVMTFRDVSKARAASLEISRVAQHDALTRLPNRTLFNDRLTQAISFAKREGDQLAVLFVDLDQFKRINDSLGHAMGDMVLRSVAGRLAACVRQSDTVCRLGGDEFVVLLSEVTSAEAASAIARKILRSISAPHIIDNKSLDITVSIGGSIYPKDGQNAESLLGQADAAMYEAKQHGRNRCQFYRSDMRVRLAKRLLLEGDLRYALGRNEFLLHYQPKIDLKTGQITGMEALIRWMHPKRGMLYPTEFVHVAEECGLIVPIGRWALLEACRQSRAWSDMGLGTIPIAVNVSAAEFQAKDFLSGVRAVLIATGVEPVNLELELTESVLMEDAEAAVITLHALKEMGVRLAIDDFGTGYSSFTYLKRFPMDTIKVDQSFVQEISTDPEVITIVSAMIDIGKSLNRRVVAEGVETRSQLDFLQRHACGEGQGYYFSCPLAAEQAGNLYKAGLQQAVVNQRKSCAGNTLLAPSPQTF